MNKYLKNIAHSFVHDAARIKREGLGNAVKDLFGKGQRAVKATKATENANVMRSQADAASWAHKLNGEAFKGYSKVLNHSANREAVAIKKAKPYIRRDDRANLASDLAQKKALKVLSARAAGAVGATALAGGAAYAVTKKD